MTGTAVVLFLSSCATAIIHALIPDHWLPFVLLGRSQGWSDRKLSVLVASAGLLHATVTVAAALVVIGIGAGSARGLVELSGRPPEFLAGVLLVAFGIVYGFYAHRREARAHGAAAPPVPERDGHLHAHGHLLERWFRRALSGGALVAVIGISPCALLVPVLLTAYAEGPVATAMAALGFAVCTILTMLAVALSANHGMRRIELPWFARYGDLASGILIAAIGLLVMRLER